MKATWILATALAAGLALGTMARAEDAKGAAEKADGKSVFTKYRCNSCHSIQGAGIERKKSTDSSEATTAKKGKKEPPDLSGVGKEKKADWIAGFLLKKETLDGEKHQKAFRGTEEELKTLAGWLESMKVDVKKKAGDKTEKPAKAEKSEK